MVRQIASPSLPRPSQSSQSFSAFPSGPSTKLVRTPLKSMDEPQASVTPSQNNGKGKGRASGGGEYAIKVVVKSKARPRSSVHASTAGQTPAIRRQSGPSHPMELEDLDPDADTDVEDTGLRTPPDSQADPLPASAEQRSVKSRAAPRAGSTSRLPTPPATQSLSSIPSLPSQLTPLRPNQRRRSAPLGSPAAPSPNPRARKTARMSTAPARRVPATAPRPARPAASQPSRRVSSSQPIRKRRQSTPTRNALSKSTSTRAAENFGTFKGADGFLVRIMKRAVSPDSPGDDPMLLGPGSMRSKAPAAEMSASFSLLDVTLPPSSARSSRSLSLAKSRSPSLLRDQAPPSNMGSSASPGWSLPVPSPRPGPIARARASRSVSFAPEEAEKTPTRPVPASAPYEISMDFAADGFDSDSDGEIAGGADDTFVHLLRKEDELESTPVPEVDNAVENQDVREEPILMAMMESRAVELADDSHEGSMLGDQSMLVDDTYDDIWEDIEDAQGRLSPAQVSAAALPEAPREEVTRYPSEKLEQQCPSSPPQEQEVEQLPLESINQIQSQVSAPIEEEQQPLRQLTPVPALEIRHASPSLFSPPTSSPPPQWQSSQHLSPQPSPRPWMRAITPRLATPVHGLLSPSAATSAITSRLSKSPSRVTPTPAPAPEETLSRPTSSPRTSRTPTPGPSRLREASATPVPSPRRTSPARETSEPELGIVRMSTPARALSKVVDDVAKLHVDDGQREQETEDYPEPAQVIGDGHDPEHQERFRQRSATQHATTPEPAGWSLLDSPKVLTPVSRDVPSPAQAERTRSRSRSVRPVATSPSREQSVERTPIRPTHEPSQVSVQAPPVESNPPPNPTTTPQYSPTTRVANFNSPSRQRSPSWPVVESDYEQDEELEGDVTVEADPADWAEEREDADRSELRGESQTSQVADGERTADRQEDPVQPQDVDRIVVRLVERTIKLETPEPEAQPGPAEGAPPQISHESVARDIPSAPAVSESTTPKNSPPGKQSELPTGLEPPVFRFTGGSSSVAGLESLLRRRSQGGGTTSSRSPHVRSPSLAHQGRSTPERSTPLAPPLPPMTQPRSLLEELQFPEEGNDEDEMSSEHSGDDEPLRGSVVEVSSMDPRAAARAAAILKLNHDYIEHGVMPPEGLYKPSERSRKNIRPGSLEASYRTEHDGDKTRDELLQEAELDILAHRRSSRSVSVAASTVARTEASDDEDVRLPGSFVFTPGRKRKAKMPRKSRQRSVIPFIEDRSWGVPEWKRLEHCYRGERKAWIEERSVKKAGRPSHGGLLSWARRSHVAPQAKEWDDMRVVERFIAECKLTEEALTGEWDRSVLFLRVQALGRRLASSPSRTKNDQSPSPVTKRARTVSPPRAPSTPARGPGHGQAQPVAPPSTVKRVLSYVFGGSSSSTSLLKSVTRPPPPPAAKPTRISPLVEDGLIEPSETSAVSRLPEMKQRFNPGPLASSTFSTTTSSIYPTLNPPLSQRSTAIQALFAPDAAPRERSAPRPAPVPVPSLRQSNGLGSSLSRSASVKDLVRSFESQEDLMASLHRVDSRGSQSSKW